MNIQIHNSSTVPLYEQIVTQVKGHILSGRLQQGEMLPSIRVLAKDLGVSIITTKRAYEDLEAEGYITTVGGKGSFVDIRDLRRLRDMQIQEVEHHLEKAVEKAKSIDMPLDELTGILGILYEEE